MSEPLKPLDRLRTAIRVRHYSVRTEKRSTVPSAQKPERLPVVSTIEEVRRVVGRIEPPAKLVAHLLYGSGIARHRSSSATATCRRP